MNPEQFYTESQMKDELRNSIIDILDDLNSQHAKLSIMVQKAILTMPALDLRKTLGRLLILKAEVMKQMNYKEKKP